MKRSISLILALLLLTVLAGVAQAKNHVPLVTGKHWAKATQAEKMSYLLGMGTIIELEKEYQGDKPLEDSLNHKLVKGLSGHTFREIKGHVDTFYDNNPDKLDVPVVEVIWYELVAPTLNETPNE